MVLQGEVKYGGTFDTTRIDQSITKVQREFVSLGNTTTQTGQKFTAFNSAINTNAKNFNASINQLKTAGPPLANLQQNLAAGTKTIQSFGTKAKETFSKFSGFATGLSATTSGVLSLAAGFRDYGDAQIAVDRVTRKLSLAQEAFNKAQAKVNDLQKAGKTGTKEYKAAVLDLDQAQQQLEIQTQLLGEAQENMFDAQTQFVASLAPAILGSVGTLGAAFKDLGFKTDSVKNAFSKLAGAGGAIGLSKLAMVGLAGAIGGVVFGLIELDKQMKLAQWAHEFDAAGGASHRTLTQLQTDLANAKAEASSWGGQLFTAFKSVGQAMSFTSPEKIKETIDFWPNVIKSIEQSINRKEAAQALGNVLSEVMADPTIANSAKPGIVSQIKNLQAILDNANNWKAGYNATAEQVSANSEAAVQAGLKKLGDSVNSGRIAKQVQTISQQLGDVLGKATFNVQQSMKPNLTVTQEQTRALYGLANSTEVVTKADKAFHQMMIDHLNQSIKNRRETEAAMQSTNSYSDALLAGNNRFQEFITTTENGIVSNGRYRDSLVDMAINEFKIANATKMSTSELELHIKAAKGDTDAIKALNDALTNAAQKGFSDFEKAAERGLGKKFKKLDIIIDDKRVGKEVDKLAGAIFKKISEGAEKGGLAGGTTAAKKFVEGWAKNPKKFVPKKDLPFFQELINWIQDPANSNLPPQTWWKNFMAKWDQVQPDAKTALGKLRSGMDHIAGEIGTDAGSSLGSNFITAVESKLKAKDWNKILKLPINKASNFVADPERSQGGNPVFRNIKLTKDFKKSDRDSVTATVNTKPAISLIEQAQKLWTNTQKIIPNLTVKNNQAIQLITQAQKLWTNTQKIVPNLTVKNKQAIQLINQVQKLWTNTAKIQPTLTLKNFKAIQAVQVVEKRIRGLENITPTIKVKFSGTGTLHASGSASLSGGGKVTISQKGYHGFVEQPTLFEAGESGKERVDIGRKSGDSGWPESSSFSGRGQIIELHLHLNRDEIFPAKELVRFLQISFGKSFRRFRSASG